MLKITNENEFLEQLNRECKQEQRRGLIKVVKEFSKEVKRTGMGAVVSKEVARKIKNPTPNPLRSILPGQDLFRSLDYRHLSDELLTRREAMNPAGYYEVVESPSSIMVTVYDTLVTKKGFSYPLYHYLRGRRFFVECLERAMNKLALVFGRFE